MSTLWNDLEKIRRTGPLVHNITNYVVMNVTANALLAIGASPVMAHAVEEIEDMASIAQALVLNIGTLSREWIEAMLLAGRVARRREIPLVVDPVGAGATRYRTETALRIIKDSPPTVLRGNASEILALAGAEAATKGVDSTQRSEDAIAAARNLNARYGCVVSISGATDIVVSATETALIENGHPQMAKVTGSGCTATALTAAFAVVNGSAFEAAAHAMALSGIAGELAVAQSNGPGSYQAHFLDLLHGLSTEQLQQRIRMTRN